MYKIIVVYRERHQLIGIYTNREYMNLDLTVLNKYQLEIKALEVPEKDWNEGKVNVNTIDKYISKEYEGFETYYINNPYLITEETEYDSITEILKNWSDIDEDTKDRVIDATEVRHFKTQTENKAFSDGIQTVLECIIHPTPTPIEFLTREEFYKINEGQ